MYQHHFNPLIVISVLLLFIESILKYKYMMISYISWGTVRPVIGFCLFYDAKGGGYRLLREATILKNVNICASEELTLRSTSISQIVRRRRTHVTHSLQEIIIKKKTLIHKLRDFTTKFIHCCVVRPNAGGRMHYIHMIDDAHMWRHTSVDTHSSSSADTNRHMHRWTSSHTAAAGRKTNTHGGLVS